MKFDGKVFKFGNDINTDEIIPARYLDTSDPKELAAHCMEDADAAFVKKAKHGDIIAGGDNFGCGSSREHAPISIKAFGVSCVVAKSFARIFYRNAINIGLPIFVSPDAVDAIKDGDHIEVDVEKGEIRNISQKKSYKSEVFPEFVKEMIKLGGLKAYAEKKKKSKKK